MGGGWLIGEKLANDIGYLNRKITDEKCWLVYVYLVGNGIFTTNKR